VKCVERKPDTHSPITNEELSVHFQIPDYGIATTQYADRN
jgi:hypothetical protein